MLIAKLSVSVKDSGIHYNTPDELGAQVFRGKELENGKVIRGTGTHFASKDDAERYKERLKDSNTVRDAFKRHFMVTPLDSTFIVSKPGEAKEYLKSLEVGAGVEAYVVEFELGSPETLDERELREWQDKIKTQLKRIPLGRGKDIDGEGIDALLALARCPVIAPATADRINEMVEELRVGTTDRTAFKRSIELLDVKMDQSSLIAPRTSPEPVS